MGQTETAHNRERTLRQCLNIFPTGIYYYNAKFRRLRSGLDWELWILAKKCQVLAQGVSGIYSALSGVNVGVVHVAVESLVWA